MSFMRTGICLYLSVAWIVAVCGFPELFWTLPVWPPWHHPEWQARILLLGCELRLHNSHAGNGIYCMVRYVANCHRQILHGIGRTNISNFGTIFVNSISRKIRSLQMAYYSRCKYGCSDGAKHEHKPIASPQTMFRPMRQLPVVCSPDLSLFRITPLPLNSSVHYCTQTVISVMTVALTPVVKPQVVTFRDAREIGRLSEIAGEYWLVSRDRELIRATALVMRPIHQLILRGCCWFWARIKLSLQRRLEPSFTLDDPRCPT